MKRTKKRRKLGMLGVEADDEDDERKEEELAGELDPILLAVESIEQKERNSGRHTTCTRSGRRDESRQKKASTGFRGRRTRTGIEGLSALVPVALLLNRLDAIHDLKLNIPQTLPCFEKSCSPLFTPFVNENGDQHLCLPICLRG